MYTTGFRSSNLGVGLPPTAVKGSRGRASQACGGVAKKFLQPEAGKMTGRALWHFRARGGPLLGHWGRDVQSLGWLWTKVYGPGIPIHPLARSRRRFTVAKLLRKLWNDDQGQDIAEYAVMLAVILVIVIGTVRLIGSNANTVFSQVGSSIQ